MKSTWMIVNAFLRKGSFARMEAAFLAAARQLDLALHIKPNDVFLSPDSLREAPPAILFMDKDLCLAKRFEMHGGRLFNHAEAIAVCDDKTLTTLAIQQAQLAQPSTIIGPMTYPNVGYPDLRFLEEAVDLLGLPLVVKEGMGSFGQQVYLARTMPQLRMTVMAISGKPLLLQRFVAETAGRDLRLYVVDGKVIAAIERINESGDFRANLESGGKALPYQPSKDEISLALAACKALQVDFAGVDLLPSNEGPLLCEINTNAHFLGLHAATGINPAEAILRMVREAL